MSCLRLSALGGGWSAGGGGGLALAPVFSQLLLLMPQTNDGHVCHVAIEQTCWHPVGLASGGWSGPCVLVCPPSRCRVSAGVRRFCSYFSALPPRQCALESAGICPGGASLRLITYVCSLPRRRRRQATTNTLTGGPWCG